MDTIRTKVRALVEDFGETDFEIQEYEQSNIFTLAESNITAIDSVLWNGTELTSGEYSYDSTTNKITINLSSGNSLSSGDKIEVDYTFNKYSDTELTKYIIGAITWMSLFSYGEDDYEVDEDDDNIRPNPDNKTEDLISIIASILIRPNYSEYRLPNITVRYPKTMPKEERIEKIVSRFQMGLGVSEIITYTED